MHCRSLPKASTPAPQNQKEKPLPSKMSPLCLLLSKLNTVPIGKGKIIKGPRTLFIDQSTGMNLEPRGNQVSSDNSNSLALAKWLSWLKHCLVHQKVTSSFPGQGTYLQCRFSPQLGQVWEATNIFSLCLSISLPSFPSRNQYTYPWARIKKTVTL